MTTETARIGVVGCGNISGVYFKNLSETEGVELLACCDLSEERAEKAAQTYSVPRVCTLSQLLADPDIDIVVNLTTPEAHYSVARQAVEAGKSVYNEKPLTATLEDGADLLKEAEKSRVLVGSAPDTFLGAGLQTCRKLLEDGWIGRPVAATAFMLCHGHESWHPDPEFYYKPGGGPLFDMGPYYLTALVSLLGPVKRVSGATQISFEKRKITSKPKFGALIDVEVPTHAASLLEFHDGVVATLVTSFDVWSAQVPRIEIYGSEGTLSVPDPNGFGGPVGLRRASSSSFDQIPLAFPNAENSRGLGVVDMAAALFTGRPHRASDQLAFHVLEIMHAVHTSSDTGRHIVLSSRCDRPDAFPLDLGDMEVDW